MSLVDRMRQFWTSVPDRIYGSRVDFKSEYATRLSTAAKFPANDKLLLRMAAQRDLIGPREVKADRRLIQENSYAECTTWGWDGNGSPVE